jgi:hypothetical protein
MKDIKGMVGRGKLLRVQSSVEPMASGSSRSPGVDGLWGFWSANRKNAKHPELLFLTRMHRIPFMAKQVTISL